MIGTRLAVSSPPPVAGPKRYTNYTFGVYGTIEEVGNRFLLKKKKVIDRIIVLITAHRSRLFINERDRDSPRVWEHHSVFGGTSYDS